MRSCDHDVQSCDLTCVLPSSTSLNEANNEQDENEQCDGAHESDEPALCGDVGVVVTVG